MGVIDNSIIIPDRTGNKQIAHFLFARSSWLGILLTIVEKYVCIDLLILHSTP